VINKTAFDIIGTYYTNAGTGGYAPGRVCESTVYYLPPGPLNALKFNIDAANRGDAITYSVVQADESTFKHNPVLRPRPLEHDEAFGIVKMKRRSVVLLSPTAVRPSVAGLPKQDFPSVYLACPMFRFHDTHVQEFRLRLEAWEYPFLFHLPPSDEFGILEGFLRLDLVIVIPEGQLRLTGTTLTGDALTALHHCFTWYLTGKMDDAFAKYRGLLLGEVTKILSSSP